MTVWLHNKIYDTQMRSGSKIENSFGADFRRVRGTSYVGQVFSTTVVMRVYPFGWTVGTVGLRRLGILYGCFRWGDMVNLSLCYGRPGAGWLDSDGERWIFNPVSSKGWDVIVGAVMRSGVPFCWKSHIGFWSFI